MAYEVFLDPPTASRPQSHQSNKPAPLTTGEKLFLVFAVAVLAGWLAWQLAIPTPPTTLAGALDQVTSGDSWIRENPKTFGLIVGVVIYIAGTISVIAIDRKE
jgi:hypothetical protein